MKATNDLPDVCSIKVSRSTMAEMRENKIHPRETNDRQIYRLIQHNKIKDIEEVIQ